MDENNLQTPGVYIDEVNAFPNAAVPAPTSIPAFVGYTPQAEYQGKSYLNMAQKITSFADFRAIYCLPDPMPPAEPAKQYDPQYYLVESANPPSTGQYLTIEGVYYNVLPDPDSIYYLYNSVRLFYENGGGDAYIVSVGHYGQPSGKALATGAPLLNNNVRLTDLQAGLALLKNEHEPTMYICPEATLLSEVNYTSLTQSMLLLNEEMQTAISILDIIGAKYPDPLTYTVDIEAFRNSTGTNGLKYGAAYYPFVGTTIMQSNEIDYTNLFGGDVKQLEALLSTKQAPNPAAEKIIDTIENPPANALTTTQINSALMISSQTYSSIISKVLADTNLLPPSGGMAGIMTVNDNNLGVWHAPANVSMVGVASLPLKLSSAQQEDLNVDAVSGKSVNAIRFFNGQGILVWGARTLDGNSQDWRYISVRRTMTFLEQTMKMATLPYAFQPNNSSTWNAVKVMISDFLANIWKQGGLQGATTADAFDVTIGLGSTMTSDDILNGIMRVTVQVAVVRPAEFIIIQFDQKMTTS